MFSTNANFNTSNETSSKFIGVGKLEVVSVKASEELDAKNQRRITISFRPADKKINGLVSKSFWLSMEPKVSKSGSNQKINAFGESSYPSSDGTFSQYFIQEGVRNAMNGEAELTEFLKVIYNFKKDVKFSFTPDAFKSIVTTGNVDGFTSGETSIIGKAVNGMVGIKDGKYTTLFPKIKFGWIEDVTSDFQKLLKKDKDSAYPLAKSDEVFQVTPFQVYDETVVNTASAPEVEEDMPF